MQQVLATLCLKMWVSLIVVMTSNLNFYVRPVLQLFKLFCVWSVKHPTEKITKILLCASLCSKIISEKLTDENHSCILLMICKQRGNKICKQCDFV